MKKEIDSIIKLAWHDKTSFEKIYRLYGVNEKEVILLMRKITSWCYILITSYHALTISYNQDCKHINLINRQRLKSK